MTDEKPSVDQLPEEICKMLQERAKAQAAADLEFALTCFKMDQQGTLKKIKDVNIDLLPTTSTSEDGSSNGAGAKADVDKKTEEVDQLLAKFEKEGVQIDGKIASIINDRITRIKAEAARENIRKPKRKWMLVLHAIGCIAFGFNIGKKCAEQAFLTSLQQTTKSEQDIRSALHEELAHIRRA